jgi:hypothetical protein
LTERQVGDVLFDLEMKSVVFDLKVVFKEFLRNFVGRHMVD